MNNRLPLSKRGPALGRVFLCLMLMLVFSLTALPLTSWGSPLPPDNIGIQGVINHGACPDAYEVDDTRVTVQTLAPGAAGQQARTFDGNFLTLPGIPDKDWAKFEVPSTGVYTLTAAIAPAGSLADPALKLYTAAGAPVLRTNGAPVESDDAGGALGNGAQIVWSATTAGTYYVEIYYSDKAVATVYDDCASSVVRYTLSLEIPGTKFLYMPLIRR